MRLKNGMMIFAVFSKSVNPQSAIRNPQSS